MLFDCGSVRWSIGSEWWFVSGGTLWCYMIMVLYGGTMIRNGGSVVMVRLVAIFCLGVIQLWFGKVVQWFGMVVR